MANAPIKRSANATWKGDVPGGNGTITTQSKTVETTYNFGKRFGNDPGTNPEELLGAAHAGRFSMALAYALTQAGHPPTSVSTTATVSIVQDDSGFTIPGIELATEVAAPGIDDAEFQKLAAQTEKTCPLSKALASVPTTLKATLH